MLCMTERQNLCVQCNYQGNLQRDHVHATENPFLEIRLYCVVRVRTAVERSNDMIFLGRNEHRIDRTIRVVVGIAVVSLVFIGPKTNWGLVGLVPLLTGLVGSCPLYRFFGLSTCPLCRQ